VGNKKPSIKRVLIIIKISVNLPFCRAIETLIFLFKIMAPQTGFYGRFLMLTRASLTLLDTS